MKFIDRIKELERLTDSAGRAEGGLVVLYGRRRIGKTRLLLEWANIQGGSYWVADQSAESLQREYLAATLARHLPGFDEVAYPDWPSLLNRISREAARQDWRGPVVLDEFPYLVSASPSLPSVMQRWLDHEAREAGLVVALAGSSQRMMRGLILDRSAPLFGRANEVIELQPIEPSCLPNAFPGYGSIQLIEAYTAWGGVPRYWELAQAIEETAEDISAKIDRLVLDPLGALHLEPDRLLLEESPPAIELRPLLDVIGAGVHRVSEIGGRLGRPATSMARPLDRLRSLSLVRREVPFGESEKQSRRGLYRIEDPFLRLWFRVVAPHRGDFVNLPRRSRIAIFRRYWPGLLAIGWEQLCRSRIPVLRSESPIGSDWGVARRWWRGNAPEWDLVSESLDGGSLLLGEVKWSARQFSRPQITKLAARLLQREPPDLPGKYSSHDVVRALVVPEVADPIASIDGVRILTMNDL